MTPRTPCTPCFSSRLDSEWERLRTSRRALERVERWRRDDPSDPLSTVIEHLVSLDDVVAATHRGATPVGSDDAILRRLVELAPSDELAGRIVIQRLLPALISRALRYRSYRDATDPIDVVVPAAWIAIRCFDTGRRRHHVAAALLSDAIFQAFRQPLRRCSSTEVMADPTTLAVRIPERHQTPAIVELADALRDARAGGVSNADLDLLRQLVRLDSARIVAAERGVTDRTIRNHRRHAVDRVRAALTA